MRRTGQIEDGSKAIAAQVVRPDDENLRRLMRLTRVMLGLADEGDRDHRDPTCAILYGTLRDMAYRLRRAAEEEYARHARDARRD